MCDSTQGSLCPSPMKIHQSMWIQWPFLQKLNQRSLTPRWPLIPHLLRPWGHTCDSTQGLLCPSPTGIHQCMWIQWSILQITNQRSLTPRWPLTPHLLRSYVWCYPRIIVSKSHENTSKYVDTVINFANYHIHTHTFFVLHTYYIHTTYIQRTYYVQNQWSHSLFLNYVQARQWSQSLFLNYVQARQKPCFTGGPEGSVGQTFFFFNFYFYFLVAKITLKTQKFWEEKKTDIFCRKVWENILTYFPNFSVKVSRFWSKNGWSNTRLKSAKTENLGRAPVKQFFFFFFFFVALYD